MLPTGKWETRGRCGRYGTGQSKRGCCYCVEIKATLKYSAVAVGLSNLFPRLSNS